MRSRRALQGFTLTEMLVVITIIGMMMALLFPALNAAVASARKTQCANNMRELGKAVQGYEADKGGYPGSAENVNGFVTSWVIMLFPYIGRGDLWSSYRNPGTGVLSTPPTWSTAYSRLFNYGSSSKLGSPPPRINQLVCPAGSPTQQCALSYVGNCGMRDGASNSTYSLGAGVTGPVVASSTVPPDWPCNGIFHNHYWLPSSTANATVGYGVYPPYQVHMSSSDVKDGLSTTLLLSENVQATEWCEPYPTIQPTNAVINSSDTSMSTNVEVYTGMLHGILTYGIPAPDNVYWSTTVYPINVARDTDPFGNSGVSPPIPLGGRVLPRPTYSALNYYQYARPSSFHSGGVNAIFCDGHAQFLSQNIAPAVYFQLMTPDERNYRFAGNFTPGSVENSMRNYCAQYPLTSGSY
jgi:prepilin-type N-terminal cleavage/methylation domain-containing protein/prepilin-type processing-associated H-X9-DG protein